MQAYSLALDIISGCWLVFVAIWVLAALSTKRTVYRETQAQRLRYWVLLVIAYFLQLYGRRLPYPLNIRRPSPCSAERMGGCSLVRHRFGLRGLGQSYSRAELERCGDTKRRTRTGGARTVPDSCAIQSTPGYSPCSLPPRSRKDTCPGLWAHS